MRLIIDGTTIGVTHMGRDFLIIESAQSHPPCEAIVILEVDDFEQRWTVRLPHGISPENNRVSLAVA